ncbi:transporter substrate-binding domain-containing protein [Reichenbachiella carrageenanivorans]|uniref:Transporter substrate-binding domain-containing protein n=1 Tax=Reichenbachiella carrageenanivorans TaxID=2979869 RepID=A0ABY6D250_9BACT|nr:transporter substrate-binding domain-containing protein [Reichenbachiella carrageenanivorans]UXX80237.1 transporter substrate-binding domain-containing protein [Reichenbachiella carrageenanivorans]
MKNTLKILSAILIICVSFCTAHAQGTLKKIVNKGELRVGLTADQPPFSMKNKQGEIIGYEVDMATLLAKSMGVKLKLVVLPFNSLIDALDGGKIDMVMSGMTITPERNLKVAFVGPYMVSGKSILTKSSILARAESTEELNEGSRISVAVLEGSTSQTFVETYMENVDMTKVKNYDEGINLVRTEIVNALVADYPFCVISAMKYGNEGMVTLDQPLTIEPIGAALPKNDPLFLNLVQNYVSSLELAGVFEMLSAKWLEDGTWMLEVE